jgi:hypothetical protein
MAHSHSIRLSPFAIRIRSKLARSPWCNVSVRPRVTCVGVLEGSIRPGIRPKGLRQAYDYDHDRTLCNDTDRTPHKSIRQSTRLDSILRYMETCPGFEPFCSLCDVGGRAGSRYMETCPSSSPGIVRFAPFGVICSENLLRLGAHGKAIVHPLLAGWYG